MVTASPFCSSSTRAALLPRCFQPSVVAAPSSPGCKLQPPPAAAALQPPHLTPMRHLISSWGKTPRFLFNWDPVGFQPSKPCLQTVPAPTALPAMGRETVLEFFPFLTKGFFLLFSLKRKREIKNQQQKTQTPICDS